MEMKDPILRLLTYSSRKPSPLQDELSLQQKLEIIEQFGGPGYLYRDPLFQLRRAYEHAAWLSEINFAFKEAYGQAPKETEKRDVLMRYFGQFPELAFAHGAWSRGIWEDAKTNKIMSSGTDKDANRILDAISMAIQTNYFSKVLRERHIRCAQNFAEGLATDEDSKQFYHNWREAKRMFEEGQITEETFVRYEEVNLEPLLKFFELSIDRVMSKDELDGCRKRLESRGLRTAADFVAHLLFSVPEKAIQTRRSI